MIRASAWVKRHPRWSVAGGVFLFLLVIYPFAAGSLAASLVASRATARLGQTVTVERGRGGFGSIVLENLVVAPPEGSPAEVPPPVRIEEIQIPLGVALGLRGPVRISGLTVSAIRGGSGDNVGPLLDRLRGRSEGGGRKGEAQASGGGSKLPDIVIERATLEARDEDSHLRVKIASFGGELRPGNKLAFRLRGVKGLFALGAEETGPHFGAAELDFQSPLEGLRPAGTPSLRVQGGEAMPLPSLALTGIAGVIAPPPVGTPGPREGLIIDLRGSYGGAREALWTAKGRAEPEKGTGKLAVRAEQFSLGRIRDVLPTSVLRPESTTLDAALDLSWVGDAIAFGGDLAVIGLSLQHEGLSTQPIENLSLGLKLRGSAHPQARRLELEEAEVRIRDLIGRVRGSVAVPAGTFRFTNGTKMGVIPRIDLAFSVPKIPCAKALASIPSAAIPHLAGFQLRGDFMADFGVKVDFANLEGVDLWGKVGIDGCKVLKAPPEVLALAGNESLILNVEVPKKLGDVPKKVAPNAAPEPDVLTVVVGPDNPDFVPFQQISPALIGSIMTTEDNGFFKHRGWISSQFKSALRRNLQRGGFRLGASSITMQMTKNVLLSREKTLSRKLQELFLVWYLEQLLPKERILELYFNAIEFGPRIYGIGAAARHYFGKHPYELNPLEAAFFSSILPSPKRRYIQYCHGTPLPQWDKYVRRILAKAHERGRVTPEEYQYYSTMPLVFDRKEATFTEKQCLEWVKSIVPKPEPETPPELEEGEGDANGGGSQKKRRMYVQGGAAGKRTHSAVRPVAARER